MAGTSRDQEHLAMRYLILNNNMIKNPLYLIITDSNTLMIHGLCAQLFSIFCHRLCLDTCHKTSFILQPFGGNFQ